MIKYQFIDRYGRRFGINWLLKKFSLYPNGYYNYRQHRRDAKQKSKAVILKRISQIYHEHEGRMGYRMMRSILKNEGIILSVQTVRRYMNVELGLKSVTRRKKHRYTPGPDPYKLFDNLLNRDFEAQRRNQKWCIDFTYVYFGKHIKRYNCTIIDLYDRRAVASVCGNRIDSALAMRTVEEAIRRSNGEICETLHSDRGSQFTSKEFIEFCNKYSIEQSMSRPGCPYDNAPMERYFNTLKAELIRQKTFRNEEELYIGINAYAYGWYNNLRPHSHNEGMPPVKVQ